MDIASEYEKQLIIPASKTAKQFIVCPVGLIGVGKTTVMKPLCERLSLIRISTDDIRKLLHDRGLGYESLPEIVIPLCQKYIDLGYSLGIDADCSGKTAIKVLEDLEKKRPIPVYWIHIIAPEEIILERLRSRSSWLFKDGEEAVKNYMERKPLHENLTMPFVYTFDTSRGDVQVQVEEAAQIISQQ